MGKRLTIEIKKKIFQCFQQEMRTRSVARQLNLRCSTVEQLETKYCGGDISWINSNYTKVVPEKLLKAVLEYLNSPDDYFRLAKKHGIVHLPRGRNAMQRFQEQQKAKDSPCKRLIKNKQLVDLIKEIQVSKRHTYGVDRMTAELNKRGCQVNHKRIERLMRKNGLNAIIRKKRNYFCAVEKIRRENLPLNRDVTVTRPGEKLVSDVTYMPLKTAVGVTLRCVKDLCTSMLVARAMSRSQNMDLAFETLRQVKEFAPNGLFHTDQGYLYINAAFAQELKKMGLTQSLSRRANCFDNAVIESFNGTMKCEWFYPYYKEVYNQVKEYVMYYNEKRIQKNRAT